MSTQMSARCFAQVSCSSRLFMGPFWRAARPHPSKHLPRQIVRAMTPGRQEHSIGGAEHRPLLIRLVRSGLGMYHSRMLPPGEVYVSNKWMISSSAPANIDEWRASMTTGWPR
jgi:hypothetical protein